MTFSLTLYDEFAIGRLVLSIVLAGVFVLLALGRLSPRGARLWALSLLTAAVLAYPNFGAFHPTQIVRAIHFWEAYHYFMGAKYLPELGYVRLYEATVVAGRELGAFRDLTHIRDLRTYDLRATSTIDAERVRGRFSPARWQAFTRDLGFFLRHMREWPGPLFDHGYNDSPARAWLLHAILRWMPASVATLLMLASLDYVLLLAALIMMWRAFGLVPAALAFASLMLSFFARFDFIGGSILRWDWAAALLLGVSALARGAGHTAGFLFGYAVLARLFPALLLVPLGVKWLQGRFSRVRDASLDRCLASAATLVLVVAAGLLLAPGTGLLGEYAARIGRHSREITSNSVGLGSLIVFNTAPWASDVAGAAVISPAAALAARPGPWLLPLATGLCLAISVPLILRSPALPSLMYGVPLIYCAFSPSGYYYSFLVLLVLLPWDRGRVNALSLVEMALLATTMGVLFAFDLALTEMLPLFNAAAIELGLFLLIWLAFEYARVLGGLGRSIVVVGPGGGRHVAGGS